MKGVSVLQDMEHDRRLVQIDLGKVDLSDEGIEDLFDLIIAESRKDSPTISMEQLVRQLKKDGKL